MKKTLIVSVLASFGGVILFGFPGLVVMALARPVIDFVIRLFSIRAWFPKETIELAMGVSFLWPASWVVAAWVIREIKPGGPLTGQAAKAVWILVPALWGVILTYGLGYSRMDVESTREIRSEAWGELDLAIEQLRVFEWGKPGTRVFFLTFSGSSYKMITSCAPEFDREALSHAEWDGQSRLNLRLAPIMTGGCQDEKVPPKWHGPMQDLAATVEFTGAELERGFEVRVTDEASGRSAGLKMTQDDGFLRIDSIEGSMLKVRISRNRIPLLAEKVFAIAPAGFDTDSVADDLEYDSIKKNKDRFSEKTSLAGEDPEVKHFIADRAKRKSRKVTREWLYNETSVLGVKYPRHFDSDLSLEQVRDQALAKMRNLIAARWKTEKREFTEQELDEEARKETSGWTFYELTLSGRVRALPAE